MLFFSFAILTFVYLDQLAQSAPHWKAADIVDKNALEEKETYLSPDDFENSALASEIQVQQILGKNAYNIRGKKIKWEIDPIMRAGKYQGDIHIANKMLDASKDEQTDVSLSQYNVENELILWPNGRIPYTISNKYGKFARAKIASAINEFHRNTCIKFVPKTDADDDYLYIYPLDGCYSSVGMQSGRQYVSLDSGCIQEGIIMHELMHAVGFYHEQSRMDRDDWIEVVYENIKAGEEVSQS